MKIIVTIARVVTGLLFIFSGLVKAIDPRGLAYKMQEFFEAWANSGFMKNTMQALDGYALSFSIIMITLEVVVGVALLLGWQKKLTAWILVLLMLFFTFLTSYVLFSGKIRACGCFGDCIPLTPIQTFTKDIILLVLALILLLNTKFIQPVFRSPITGILVLLSLAGTIFLQWYVLRHLPVKDCLPYKVGNNLIELRKMPANAVPDKFDYVFVYEKNGEKKDFNVSALPDSTWKFAERKQKLIQAGSNNIPLINDFSFTSEEGADVTESILNEPGEYFLFYMKELPSNTSAWLADLQALLKTKKSGQPFYVVTSTRGPVTEFLNANKVVVDGIVTCDATAIKTVARANPTIYKMRGPVVLQKASWADLNKIAIGN